MLRQLKLKLKRKKKEQNQTPNETFNKCFRSFILKKSKS